MMRYNYVYVYVYMCHVYVYMYRVPLTAQMSEAAVRAPEDQGRPLATLEDLGRPLATLEDLGRPLARGSSRRGLPRSSRSR